MIEHIKISQMLFASYFALLFIGLETGLILMSISLVLLLFVKMNHTKERP